ncbi:hypothetical protein HU200_066206 [Digitaria exilis]|uniref:Uncharacterized protein n=1 Tax=Digitaria exilis TaxID=1010633 RepID=A0A834ZXE4_9POAL|nr:hypothetical protein HU200_066206 [Digitaria exilis]
MSVYGRRKIGRSFVHTRYFVLEPRMLSYYKRKPQNRADKVGGNSPSRSLPIDGNCRVEDRGLKMHHDTYESFIFLFFFLAPFLFFTTLRYYDDEPFRALPSCCRCFTSCASTTKGRSTTASR